MTTRCQVAGMVFLPIFFLLFTASALGQAPTLDPKWSDAPSPRIIRAIIEDEIIHLGIQDKVTAEDLDVLTRLKVKADSLMASDEERTRAYKELLTRLAQWTGAPAGVETRLDRTVQVAVGLSRGGVVLPGEFSQIEKRGSGPIPVILIPDIGLDWTMYESLMNRNLKAYTMYALTLPGFAGTSPYPRPKIRNFSHTDWWNAVEQGIVNLIKKENLSGVVLVGQQAGAYVAMKTALDHPDQIKAVVNLNGLLYSPMSSPADKTKPATHQERAQIINSSPSLALWPNSSYSQSLQFASGFSTFYCQNEARQKLLSEMMAKTRLDVMYRYFYELMTTDLSETAQKLTVPLLVVISSPDAKMTVPGGWNANRMQWEKFKAENPKLPLTLVTFEDTRAYATEDSPEDLDRAIGEFLAGKPVAGKTKAGG